MSDESKTVHAGRTLDERLQDLNEIDLEAIQGGHQLDTAFDNGFDNGFDNSFDRDSL